MDRPTKGRPRKKAPKDIENTYHIPLKSKKGDCVVCKPTKRRTTQITCSVCKVGLCLQKGDDSCYALYPKRQQTTNTRPPEPEEGASESHDLLLDSSFQPHFASTPMEVVEEVPLSL